MHISIKQPRISISVFMVLFIWFFVNFHINGGFPGCESVHAGSCPFPRLFPCSDSHSDFQPAGSPKRSTGRFELATGTYPPSTSLVTDLIFRHSCLSSELILDRGSSSIRINEPENSSILAVICARNTGLTAGSLSLSVLKRMWVLIGAYACWLIPIFPWIGRFH